MGIDFKVKAFENPEQDINFNDFNPKSLDPEKKEKNKVESKKVPEHLKAVYNEIEKGKIHIDALSQKTKIPVFKLLPILTELELLGFVRAESGRTYSIN